MTVTEIYAHIRDSLFTVVPKMGWSKALLHVERAGDSQGYDGTVLAEEQQLFFSLLTNSLNDVDDIYEPVELLHRLTTQSGNGDWNVLYFTLTPDGTFEVDFILDEDAVTARKYISDTRAMPETPRRHGYRALQQKLAQARSTHLYGSISRHLVALATTVDPAWQRITLRIEQWVGGFFKLTASLQTDKPSGEKLEVNQEWSVVKEVYQLIHMDYVPNWNIAHWTATSSGEYAIVFDWEPNNAHPNYPPRNMTFPYTREGCWKEST